MPIQSTQQPPSPREELWVCHLGRLPYRDALALQLSIRERRLTGELPDVLLLLEHPPVYTRGRRSESSELALGEELYRARGIQVVQSDRGGRVTYHGPGQLVGYPIMAVADVGVHLRRMEAAIVAALGDFGLLARSRCAEGPDYTGVWVGGGEDPADAEPRGAGQGARSNRADTARKIASIGVHLSRGVSTHGFAVNVHNDLAPFDWIVACGLPDVRMTSLARELPPGRTLDPEGFRARIAHHFAAVHHRRPRTVTPAELGLAPWALDAVSPPPPPSTWDRTSHAHPLGGPARRADAPQEDHRPDAPTPVPLRGAPA